MSQNLVVVTGGPGAGKSTLIDALAESGFRCVPESGRAVIRAQVASGGTALPWRDVDRFAQQMAAVDLAGYRGAPADGAPVFFDRGIPDTIGYLRLEGRPVPPQLMAAARRCRYRSRVFVAPPWPRIYRRDAERRQSLAEASQTCRQVSAVYAELGYALIVLPMVSVRERVGFVLRDLRVGGLDIPSGA